MIQTMLGLVASSSSLPPGEQEYTAMDRRSMKLSVAMLGSFFIFRGINGLLIERLYLSSFVTKTPGQCVCNARLCHKNKIAHFRRLVHRVVKGRMANASVSSCLILASSLQKRVSFGLQCFGVFPS